MQSLYVPFVLFLFHQPLFADEYNFLAEPEVEEEQKIDPKDLWPNKIILDSANQTLMLVWFEEETKSTKILFSNVRNLYAIPSDDGLGAELQLETKDGTSYLMAYNYAGTQQQSLLLSALLAVNVQGNVEQEKRISNHSLRKRKEPALVVGSIEDAGTLLPTGTVIEEQLLHSSAVGEEIGEGIPEKSTGALSRASVEIEIKRNMSRFRGCYQKALGQVPDLQGTVQIQFSVNKDGRVSGARISSSTLKNALAERCILRNIYGIRFPEPSGGVAIFNYPFTFTRRE